MPWQPLPRIAFAIATFPFAASEPADLPLEIGDELYIIEETHDGQWLRGYLVAPPSLLAGLTSVKGQTLEARVFSGIFPRSCVEVREVLGEDGDGAVVEEEEEQKAEIATDETTGAISTGGGATHKDGLDAKKKRAKLQAPELPVGGLGEAATARRAGEAGAVPGQLSMAVQRKADEPRPPAPVPMLKIGDETATSASEPLIDEIASCLREWHSTNLHQLLLSRQYSTLDQLAGLIATLDLSRQQFLHNVLTRREHITVREKTVWDLVRVNKLCGGEVIVRDSREKGRVLTVDDSVVQITELQSIMSLMDEPPMVHTEPTSLHHLLVDVKGLAGATGEATSLVMYLASKSPGGALAAISESYIVDLGGSTVEARTLFADLSPADIGDAPSTDAELFLVAVVRAPRPVVVVKPASRSGSITQLARPPLLASSKSMRRSLMWGGRTALLRGSPKLDALPEQFDDESRDGKPPSTTTSSSRPSLSDSGAPTTVERTVGAAVLKLKAVMQHEEQAEHVLSIWAPCERLAADRSDDKQAWDPVLHELMDAQSSCFERFKSAERLQLLVQAFKHADADVLIKSTPTTLANITKTSKMGFTGAPTKPRSDIYMTIDGAHLAKHALLSRVGAPASALAGGVHGHNLQAMVEVRRPSGELIEDCIYPASNADALSTWKTVAVGKGEYWRQTIRLHLAPQDVLTAHLVVHVADLPGPPFAMAYMPLWDNDAFIRDGAHALVLYKSEQQMLAAPASYLGLAFAARPEQADVPGLLATVRVTTFLCSTRLSQDRVLLGLLQWKDTGRSEMLLVLQGLMFVAEIEMVKLLDDVLDALFGILVEYAGSDEYEDFVFAALVRVLGIVHDRRFDLAPLVDQYAETKFNYPAATPCLVRSFARLLSKPSDPETAPRLRATLKVGRHVLNLIRHSREQQKTKEAELGITGSGSDAGFTRQLRSIFKALDAMMRSTMPVLVGSQTLAVQHFHTWLPGLAGLLTTEEILHMAIDFMDSCAAVTGKLVLYKLVLIINYARLAIFAQPEQRAVLSANTVRWIAPHWGRTDQVTDQWRDQVRLCCSVLASQADHLGPEIPDHLPKLLDSYLAMQALERKPRKHLSLLFPTQYPFPTKPLAGAAAFDEALVELSAVLSAMTKAPAGLQLELVDQDLHVVMANTLRVHLSILQGEAFPANWLSVHIFHHQSTMQSLQYLAGILLDSFIPHPDEAESFDTELWRLFFAALLMLVASPSLALETFAEQKRRAVWKIAGDVREHGAALLRRTWEAIGWETSPEERARYGLARTGGYQVQYVPALVGPIVELCLSVHEGLRRMAVEVLQTMIVSEWALSEDLSLVQTEMMDALDLHFKSKPLTETILQKLFVDELVDRFAALASVPGDPLHGALAALTTSMHEFLDLLVAVHSSDGSGEAQHLMHRLRLMEFLRDMHKKDIFVRYVHQLADLQAAARNQAEAGLALRLHADLYAWDPIRTAPALHDPMFPSQTLFERKERIYFDMIKHFEDGAAWGSALDAYKELRAQYETNVFDLAKLARTERAIAAVLETLAKGEKLVPKYFRVAYKGLGFPPPLRDKEFIVETAPAERKSALADRLQEQYPAAQVFASDHIDDVEGQFIVLSSVAPLRDLGHQVYQRARVPPPIRDFLVSQHPREFSADCKRSTSGPVAEHYADKLVYRTAEPFPTILRRSEIVAVRQLRLSAPEAALERIVRKTAEMAAVEKRLGDGSEASSETARLLLDAVRISLNPDSENSVVCYRALVPGMVKAGGHDSAKRRTSDAPGDGDDDNENENDDDDNDMDDTDDAKPPEPKPPELAIKMALLDHAIMLKRCLTTFQKSSHDILAQNAEDLLRVFSRTFAPEIESMMPVQPPHHEASAPSPTGWHKHSGSVITATSPRPTQAHSLRSTHANGADDHSVAQPAVSILREAKGTRLSFLGGRRKDSHASQHRHANGNASLHAEDDSTHVNGKASSSPENKAAYHQRRTFFFGGNLHLHDGHANGAANNAGSADANRTMVTDWVTDSGGNNTTAPHTSTYHHPHSSSGLAPAALVARTPRQRDREKKKRGQRQEDSTPTGFPQEGPGIARERSNTVDVAILGGGGSAAGGVGASIMMGKVSESVRKRLSLLRLGGNNTRLTEPMTGKTNSANTMGSLVEE